MEGTTIVIVGIDNPSAIHTAVVLPMGLVIRDTDLVTDHIPTITIAQTIGITTTVIDRDVPAFTCPGSFESGQVIFLTKKLYILSGETTDEEV